MERPSGKSVRKRCVWCHRRSGELKTITVTVWDRFALHLQEQSLTVHPEHETKLRAFCDYFRRYGRRFLALIAALTVGLFVVAAASLLFHLDEKAVSALTGALMAVMGVVIVLLPFCTPETVKMMGVKSAVNLARALGVITVAIGAAIAGLGVFV